MELKTKISNVDECDSFEVNIKVRILSHPKITKGITLFRTASCEVSDEKGEKLGTVFGAITGGPIVSVQEYEFYIDPRDLWNTITEKAKEVGLCVTKE